MISGWKLDELTTVKSPWLGADGGLGKSGIRRPWDPQVVTKIGGTFTVKWDDPYGGPEESEVDAKDWGISWEMVIHGDWTIHRSGISWYFDSCM